VFPIFQLVLAEAADYTYLLTLSEKARLKSGMALPHRTNDGIILR
jgi:hypothetical protein